MKEDTDEVYHESKAYVVVDGKDVLVDATEFLDIAEDIFGRDQMTFKYKGEVHQSLVFRK